MEEETLYEEEGSSLQIISTLAIWLNVLASLIWLFVATVHDPEYLLLLVLFHSAVTAYMVHIR